jgi:hypothetical protein
MVYLAQYEHLNTGGTVAMSVGGMPKGGEGVKSKVETRLGSSTIRASIRNNNKRGQGSRVRGARARR